MIEEHWCNIECFNEDGVKTSSRTYTYNKEVKVAKK